MSKDFLVSRIDFSSSQVATPGHVKDKNPQFKSKANILAMDQWGNTPLHTAAIGSHRTQLVEMLKRPPKHVPQLRTRDGFRRFFSGLRRDHMRVTLVLTLTLTLL